MQTEAMTLEEALEALQSEDVLTRAKAASRLGELRHPDALDPLIELVQTGTFESEDEVLVLEFAMFALTQLGDRRAVPAIARHLFDAEYVETEESACDALSNLGGSEAEEALRKKFLEPDCDVLEDVAAGIYSLEKERCAPFFLEQLRSNDPRVLRIAAEILGELDYEPAILHLQRVARNPDPEVREAAAEALEMIIGPEVRGLGLRQSS